LRCPYCGTEARLPEATLASAREYERGVAQRLARAGEHAQIARAYAELEGARVEAAPRTVDVAGTACGSCGAASRFESGAMLASCQYCGASLLANASVQTRGLDAAAAAARAARLEALKHERRFAQGLARRNRFMSRYGSVVFVGLPALASVVAWQSARADAREQAVFLACASLVALVTLGSLALWQRRLLERTRSVVCAAGHELVGLAAVLDWLNTHWADDFYVYDLSSAERCRAATSEVQGYRVLIFANPLPRPGTPFLELLLSAWYPGRSERGEGPVVKGERGAREALTALGFELKSGPAGIRACIRGDDCRRRLRDGVDLGAAITALARVAASQGGRPGLESARAGASSPRV
jgi:hypothetical protein